MDGAIYHCMHEVEDHHWWFSGRRRIVNQLLERLPLPSSPRILDAGCGTGGNLAMLSRFGEVTGIERDHGARAIAIARGPWRIERANFPNEIPAFSDKFDLVVLLDVLEHIDEDAATLRALKRLLAPGGYLVITVPAFQFLWSRHDVEHHHMRRYVASDLRNLIQESGLRIQLLSYYNTWLFPLVAAIRLLDRIFGSQQVGGNLKLPGTMINRILSGVFSSERHVLTRTCLPFGVSLLAVAQSTPE
jgi:SAM-dependent methyltransferase